MMRETEGIVQPCYLISPMLSVSPSVKHLPFFVRVGCSSHYAELDLEYLLVVLFADLDLDTSAALCVCILRMIKSHQK